MTLIIISFLFFGPLLYIVLTLLATSIRQYRTDNYRLYWAWLPDLILYFVKSPYTLYKTADAKVRAHFRDPTPSDILVGLVCTYMLKNFEKIELNYYGDFKEFSHKGIKTFYTQYEGTQLFVNGEEFQLEESQKAQITKAREKATQLKKEFHANKAKAAREQKAIDYISEMMQ